MTTPLLESRMAQRAEHARVTHFAKIPAGDKFEDVVKPQYWVHGASRLKQNHLIEAVADDGSFDALLRVVDKDLGLVRLRVLYVVKDEKAAASKDEANDTGKEQYPCIKHVPNGQSKGWRLFGVNGDIVEEGIQQKADAVAKLERYKERLGS